LIKTVWGVTFYVSDLNRAKEFYEKTLGLEKKYEFPSYVGFECGGVEIGLIPKPDKKQCTNYPPDVEFLVDNVEECYRRLKAKGVKFVKELHDEPWGGKQAVFLDPDGNRLEIVQIDWEKYFTVSASGAAKTKGSR